jgi:hypothetical protein
VRAHLTRLGIVDDPHARRMRSPDRRRTAAVFHLPGVRYLRSEDEPSFLADAGWTASAVLTGSDLDEAHLGGTKLAGTLTTLNTTSFVAVAER